MKQETFMMLKPDAFANDDAAKVLFYLQEHGLTIEKSKVVEVCMEDMKTLIGHYEQVIDEKGKAFNFPGKLFNAFYFMVN